MRRFLPWLILLFPALELWVLIQVGTVIGALSTIGLLIVSMFVGLALLKLRGLSIGRTMQAELAAGRMPSNQIIDTFCLMIAGCLFIFPGFVSDIIAVLLIIPGVRHILLSLFVSRLRSHGFQAQTMHFESTNGSGPGSGPITWTCTTYGSASTREPDRHEPRGNAVVIDCEPEVITGNEDADGGPHTTGGSGKPR